MFSRVIEGSTVLLGEVCLPVTIGTRNNYHSELIDFDVAHIGLQSKAIMGYPTLAKFMAAIHHCYNILKMSGYNGIITIACDQKDVVHSVEHTYTATAIDHSHGEGDVGPREAAGLRKKQSMSTPRPCLSKKCTV